MCIRDSPYFDGDRETLTETFEAAGERDEMHESASLGQAATCLLYTSDAADERSSVDLGGRRILKKKTKAEQSADRTANIHMHYDY